MQQKLLQNLNNAQYVSLTNELLEDQSGILYYSINPIQNEMRALRLYIKTMELRHIQQRL